MNIIYVQLNYYAFLLIKHENFMYANECFYTNVCAHLYLYIEICCKYKNIYAVIKITNIITSFIFFY